MSITLSISLHTKAERVPSAFIALIDRVADDSSIVEMDITAESIGSPRGCDARIGTQEFSSIVDSVAVSDEMLHVGTAHTLPSGNDVYVSCELKGTQYMRGSRWAQNGAVTCWFSYGQMTRVMEEVRSQIGRSVPASGEGIGYADMLSAAATGEVVVSDCEALFLACTGVVDNRVVADAFDSSLLYLDEWTPGPGCAMRFHRNAADFARDFPRMYALFHFQCAVPDLCRLSGKVAEYEALPPHPYRPSLKEWCDPVDAAQRPRFYRANWARELQFYATLTRDAADRLVSLPESTVREQLKHFAETDLTVTFCEIDGGVALTEEPLSTVLPVYEYLLRKNT